MEINEKLKDLIYKNLFDEAKHLISNQKGIDLNYKGINGRTPLLMAIGKDNLDFVDFLIKNGADVNYSESYILPLEEAIETAANKLDYSQNKQLDTSIIQLLIKHQGDVNLKDRIGETPLIFLKRYFGFDNMQEFLQHYTGGAIGL